MSFSHLVPVSHFISGFTTCTSLHHANISIVPLTDDALNVHKNTARTPHRLVAPPRNHGNDKDEPTHAWEAFYPKHSINPSGKIPGGFGFYLSGPNAFAAAIQDAHEVLFSYRMMLQDNWNPVKGGKLPGIFGGVREFSYGCSGGRQEDRCKCFSLRLMWRAHSSGELYTYLPQASPNTTQLLRVPPTSTQNSDYGFSVGRGSFDYKSAIGKWATVAIRAKLNDIGHENGEIQVYMDGKSVIHATGLVLRDDKEGKFRGMQFQTFFGGHKEDWATPIDQRAWFADVTGVIVA